MSETPTPLQTEEQDDKFSDIIAFQEHQEAQAARRIVETSQPEATAWNVDTYTKKPNVLQRKGVQIAGAVALTAGAAAGLAATTADAVKAPTFSEETTTYTVQPGDGLQNAAQNIEGSDTIDIRDATDHISVDPANIDVLKDGLQPGETLVIPEQVEQ